MPKAISISGGIHERIIDRRATNHMASNIKLLKKNIIEVY